MLWATKKDKPIAHKYLSSNNVLLGRNLSAKVPILRTFETHALKRQ